MTRLTIFLFFFTLSTMAQQVQDTLGKVKTPQEDSNINPTIKCVIGGRPQPVFFLDGEIFDNTKKVDERKSLKAEDIAVYHFRPKMSVNFFGKQAVGGAIYIVTKEAEKKIKEIQHKKLGKLTQEEYKYYQIAQILRKKELPITVTGRVTDDEDNPIAGCKIENREQDFEVYTDSMGEYEIKARRWDTILSECVGQCRVVVTDSTEQTMDFVRPPLKKPSIDYITAGLVTVGGSPCDKLFVLNGKPMKDKKQFFRKIKNSKEIKAREIAQQEAMALYGTQGRFGIVAVRDEKGRKQDKIYTRKFKRKMRKTQQL
ncbi:carboxypeptidase-like regulatory domain-containing protein [Capnocytophaga gingivalis]|uniref:Carboxypeptidase-like regulatory domain-containing protein n=1 Tax=Capnocytophaga gingivalis TaxID=1017 RepID=A0ABU5Z689_9FLAO|nr:carboxypeptidase-like regulatory domain-containing protein [Capnocytophaga gingivalis]MEB3074476.1 carboxypeptidase-like regulatory domain-containing protein [Capnocytophaga gingivalis]